MDVQDSARETLGCVMSERTTINDKLSSVELLRHLAKAEYKANFESEFDDDTVSLAAEGIFAMTLNRRTRAIKFQPT
ncbi:hypothetical protein PSP20601_05609 [Pandoraea sputorum]|nr:hypothetical protein PSP20601_05609 [Pandoraea sputorum]